MSLVVKITPENGFLHVLITGEFSLTESKTITARIFETLLLHSLQKVLVDFRQVTGDPELVERYLYSVFVSAELDRFYDAGGHRFTRFAYVGAEALLDRRRFGETVALNRGVKVKVTDSMAEARCWLEIDPVNTCIDLNRD